ncbi:multidrug resistance-associated ABC transporter [Hysterangium stoloniferum]|nr:multidrug resistance-associated ABC transporter [Hysterangium stoloniferum]
MPRYQLGIAIALVVSAVCSAVFFFWLSPRPTSKIQLPVSSDTNDEFESDFIDEDDPFSLAKAEDFSDGIPIDEDNFWARTRVKKVFLLALFAAILAVDTIALGFSIPTQAPESAIISFGLRILFDVYLVIITAFTVQDVEVPHHWVTIVHLASLSTLGFFLTFVASILPETDDVQASAAEPTGDSDVLLGLWYTNLVLMFLSTAVTLTVPRGPKLHFPSEAIYSEKTLETSTTHDYANVCGIADASVFDFLLFSYTTKVILLGVTSESLEIGDLPIVTANMRATTLFHRMRTAMRQIKVRPLSIFPSFLLGSRLKWQWKPRPGSGWMLMYKLAKVNSVPLTAQICLAVVSALLFYSPAFFLQKLVKFLETSKTGEVKDIRWGWVYCIGLFVSNATIFLLTGQLWSLSITTLQVRIRIQLNSVLYAKTLVRKDVASSSTSSQPTAATQPGRNPNNAPTGTGATADPFATTEGQMPKEMDDEGEFSSKAQIMTLMTTDVDRVSEFAWHSFSLVDSPIEIVIGSYFLYKLLGISCFIGLAVTCLFLPMNHWASKVVVTAQDSLMKARDERISLMNEILGAIRMLKFMAWERNFEKKVLKIREKELYFQRRNYIIETLFNIIWNASPVVVTLVSFWHFTVVRQQALTPSIAFTSIAIFTEMKFALNALPETFINMLQSIVSIRRIEKYLGSAEVAAVPPLESQDLTIAFNNATITWPQDRGSGSTSSSLSSTPRHKFILVDITLKFPEGEFSLICGRLGSGKTLLLLSLLGEADLLSGQICCPRSPPNAIASFVGVVPDPDDWVVQGLCAYVPQAAWLRNASIKENILFNLPYVEDRYQKTLEVCALISDLTILEDGDESEIGERGVNLSGGQKARVSLARAVYSRASVLLLDDVLSAVDAHTAHHLYENCLKGELLRGRTVILVSHHVQLCAPGASYVVAMDNGRVTYAGDSETFRSSGVIDTLISDNAESKELKAAPAEVNDTEIEMALEGNGDDSETSSTVATTTADDTKAVEKRKAPRKLIEEEKRAVGRISREVWKVYTFACGGAWYWLLFIVTMVLATASPVIENGWLKIWSGAIEKGEAERGPMFYVGVYATVTGVGLIFSTVRWFVLYSGSIHASTVLYKRILESVLFAHIRFHDTISRGRLLNRFGKDFEGIDSSLSDNFGRSIINGLSVFTTVVAVTVVGGIPFLIAIILLSSVYYSVGKVYGQTSRDMRRLDSVTRSPLYSIYGETISGVTILRAFGAGSKFLRDMLYNVDTNINPYFWMWGVNRWLSIRFNLTSAAIVGITGLVVLLTPGIDASLAGFALAFVSTMTNDLLFMVRRFVGLEQSLVAVERVKEFSELPREPPEFIEPRPAANWPSQGEIVVEDLSIRYAPELPNVLHNLTFSLYPGERVGILGRTGCGKSTLALSFFRFVEASQGRILIDGLDISKIGLTDLRSRLTIIPQDPTILSGTLRSTLDVFDEYDDAEIFEALRRVHLIPSADAPEETVETVNENVFRDLDSPVMEAGDNFSTGEKQLICMARAILKRAKVLLMDEATASVDYATDELISKTIRQEFADSTIMTIAHRLRTVVDYNRVMLLDEGRIVEFDTPARLLSDPNSRFYALCKATGKNEFAVLKRMAGVPNA